MKKTTREEFKQELKQYKKGNSELLKINKKQGKKIRKTMRKHISLESIINRSPAMVFLWPIQEGWPVEFVTVNVEQVLGYTKDDFISGKVSWPDITHSDDVTRLEAEVASFLKDEITEFSQEYRLITKSGEIRWMRDQNTVLFDETGTATHIQSIVLDITELKNAEKAFLESEEKYRLLVEQSIEGIVIAKANPTRLVYSNEAFANITGYSIDELLSLSPESIETLVHQSDRKMFFSRFADRLKGKKVPQHYELRAIRKDSAEIWLAISSKRLEYNGKPAVLAIFTDITEHKRTEEALRESEEKYRNLVENLNDIFYVLDKYGVCTYVSPSIKIVCGYKQSKIIGQPFAQFIYPDDLPDLMDNFRKIKNGKNEHGEYRIITKSGEIRWVLTSSRPLFSGNDYIGIQGLCTDITERKHIEEELDNAQKDLEEKSMSLEESNTALKILLQHQDSDRKSMEKNIAASIQKLIMPYLEKIKNIAVDEQEKTYIKIIETNLSNITKTFIKTLDDSLSKLTPTEIQIVNLIIENKNAKEISGFMNISETTVFFHRRNIRKKLGIKNKKKNLCSFLQSYKNNK